MSKKKIIDTSLIDKILQNNELYSTILPDVDTRLYTHTMQYAPSTAREKDQSNWEDTFAMWNKNRNSVNKDTYLGKYIMNLDDIETLLKAEQYVLDKLQLNEMLSSMSDEPDQESLYQINKLMLSIKDNEESYTKAYSEVVSSNLTPIYFHTSGGAVKTVQLPNTVNSFTSMDLDKLLEAIRKTMQSKQLDNENYLLKALEYKEDEDYYSKKISDYYNYRSSLPGMDLTDIDTYVYKLPGLMGSSAGTLGANAIGMASSLLLSNPYTAPIGAVGAIVSNLYSRDFESAAEVYQAYKEKVKQSTDKDVLNKVLGNARKQLQEVDGITQDQLDDEDFLLDQVLTNKVSSLNAKFNDNAVKSMNGLESVYMDNMALSSVDVLLDVITVTPIGKVIKGAKALVPTKVLTTASKLSQKASKRIDDVISFGLEGLNKIPKKNIRKQIVDLGGRMAITSVLEGQEEGTQYMLSKDYKEGIFDSEAGIFNRWLNNVGRGIRSTYAALTPWDPIYSSDREFLENYKGGALLGGIMTGFWGGATTYLSVRDQTKQLKYNEAIANIYANKVDEQDRMNKNLFYAQQAANNRWDRVEAAFDNLSEAGIEGFELNDIEEERKRARNVYNLYTSVLNLASAEAVGIDTKSEDYLTYTALKMHHMDRVKDAKSKLQESINSLTTTLNSKQLLDYVNSLDIVKNGTVEPGTVLEAIKAKANLDAANILIENILQDKLATDKIALMSGIKANRNNILKLQDVFDDNKKFYQNTYDNNEAVKTLKAIKGFDENILTVPTMHNDILEATQQFMASQLALSIEEQELKIMNELNEKAVRGKIDKYNQVREEDIEFIQTLNDIRSKRYEDRVKEDAKEVNIPTAEDAATESKEKEEVKQTREKVQLQNAKKDIISNIEDKQTQQEQKEEIKLEKDLYISTKAILDRDKVLEDEEVEGYADRTEETDKILEKLFRLKYPTAHNYYERLAYNKMQDDTEIDNLFLDLYVAKLLLKKALLSSDSKIVRAKAIDNLTEIEGKARDLAYRNENKQAKYKHLRAAKETIIEELVSKDGTIKFIGKRKTKDGTYKRISTNSGKIVDIPLSILEDNGLKFNEYSVIVTRLSEYRGINRSGEYTYSIILTSFSEGSIYHRKYEIKSPIPLHEVLPTILQEEKANNIKDLQKKLDQDKKQKDSDTQVVDDKPEGEEQKDQTLEDVLGSVLGGSYTQAVEQQKQQELENKPIDTTEKLVYDQAVDPYSHQLGYHLTQPVQRDDGVHILQPIPYSDAPELLNNEEFATITGNDDFYAEVTKNGIEVVVKPGFTNPKTGKVTDSIYLVFNYKGKKYGAYVRTIDGIQAGRNTPFLRLPYDLQLLILKNLKALRDKILSLNEIVKRDPSKAIMPVGIRMSNGRIVNLKNEDGSPKNRKLTDWKFQQEKDPYKIDYQNTQVAITTGPLGSRYARRNNQIVSTRGANNMGAAQIIVPVTRQDGTVSKMRVQLNSRSFKGDSAVAEYILDLLLNEGNVITKDNVTIPVRALDLLKLIVNYGAHTATNSKDSRLDDQQIQARLAKQFYQVDDNHYMIGNTVYSTLEIVGDKRQQILDYIENNFHWNLDEDNLTKNWFGDSNTVVSGFQQMRAWFKNTGKDKIVLIPNVLEFSKEDFGINNANEKGISSLGWYIKNGILLTDAADRLEDVNIYIDDVTLVDKGSIDTQVNTSTKVAEDHKTDGREFDLPGEGGSRNKFTMDDIFSILDGDPDKKGPDYTVENIDSKHIDIPEAVMWLSSKLGIDPEIVQGVIEVTSAGLNVVGRARVDSIVLSELAPEGTQYHEAWHRVSQLLISPSKREAIFKRYRKQGLNDKQIDELLAEAYRSFMLYADSKDNTLFRFDFDSKNWFRKVFDFTRLWIRTGQYGLAKVMYYTSIGKYKGVKPSQLNIDRFNKLYSDGADMQVNGITLKSITTEKQLDDIIKSLLYAFFLTDFANSTIDYYKLAKDKPSFDNLLRLLKNTQATDPNRVNPIMDEIIERFEDVIVPRLITKLKSIGIRTFDKDNSDIANIEEGADRVNVGQHTVEGMNISIKDNAPAEVKFFFLTIPVLDLNNEGKLVNKLHPHTGFAQFYDANLVWTSILKDLSGCRNIRNIMDTVARKAETSTFYKSVLNRLVTLVKQSVDATNPSTAIRAEAMLSKLETVITCDVNNYLTVKVQEDIDGIRTIRLLDNGIDVKAMKYPKIWSKALFYNSGIFSYKGTTIVPTSNAKHTLQTIAKRIGTLTNIFALRNGILISGTNKIDFHDIKNLRQLKNSLITMLNSIGIGIDEDTFNRILESPIYGDINADEYTKLSRFVTSTANYGGLLSIKNTIQAIVDAITPDGKLKDIVINNKVVQPNNILTDNGFVKVLANEYAYVHATDSGLSSIGAEGNTYYKVSQNNFFKDRINELNTDREAVDNLSSVVYNRGSLILKSLKKGAKLAVETFINFKDDTSREKGRDYFGITDREDYIAKMAMIMNDRIISPTIGDKKTYHVISGVELYHDPVNFLKQADGKHIITYGDRALDVILDYVYDEYNRVKLTIAQLDPNSPEYLLPDQRIKNYHTNNSYKDSKGVKHTVEPNGTRFINFTGIYTNQGFISFNDPKKSSAENLQVAEDMFFNLPREFQRILLSGVINQRVKEEVEYAKSLGIISSNLDGDIWSLRNQLLDNTLVGLRINRYNLLDTANAEGYAIWDIMSDYVIGSLISVNEIEKIFSGDPAYYKVIYSEDGIIDNSVDKIKRSTALTSTGTNNRLDFFNDRSVPTEYTVAELKDHEVKSKLYAIYEELFFRGNIKETIQELEGQSAWEEVKDLSISEIEKRYPEAVKIARQAAKSDVSGYKSGINVADAAVYISPEMFKNLMRMQGLWSPDVKRAFKILTDEKTADKWESDPKLYAQANKVILNSLKYMAFGTRFRNGLGIPYFNKMALFPLFKSIATGDLKPLYERMTDKNNPLDMVMFNSAVKAGSENAQSYYEGTQDRELELKDGSTILAAELMDIPELRVRDLNKLHVYKQSFKYLRQQLLTDPHTHEDQMAGTQFLKVNLSNLRSDDMYGQDGDQVTGEYIKLTIMDAINKLSDIGKKKIEDKLLNNKGEVDERKLAKMLLDDARESDANDNIISALSQAVKDGTFSNMPLSALSDNKWLESRFISLINKEIIDIQLPGGAFIQRSVFGVEATDTRVITPSMINDGRYLKTINEEGSMDAVVSINLLKHIIPNYDKMTFKEARQWLLDHNIIGQNAKANSIGYRIPTQSIASISALRFVDVFPEIMGDVVMLPEDFTKLTGSDKYHCLNQYNIKNLFNCWKTLRAFTDWATSSQAVRY